MDFKQLEKAVEQRVSEESVEVNPRVFVDGVPLVEGQDYHFNKLEDKSIRIFLLKQQLNIKISPPQENKILLVKEATKVPRIYLNNVEILRGSFVIETWTNRDQPGIEIRFKSAQIKALRLLPKVLFGMEARKYKAQKMREERSNYEKEHSSLF